METALQLFEVAHVDSAPGLRSYYNTRNPQKRE